MVEKIKIKKELTEVEFEQVLAEFQESILKQENTDDLSQSFQELVKKITPAKEVHLLIFSEIGKRLKTVTLEKNITIDISSSKGILVRCCQIKEALFSNDVARDPHYHKETDNFLDYPLKNLLVVPLLNEDKEILALIWAGIPKKDWNQYMQSDIKYMMQVPVLNEKMIQEEDPEEEMIQIKELQEEAGQESTTSMAKRLKSWLFK